MPSQHVIWKVGAQLTPLSLGKLASELALEAMIVRKPDILSAEEGPLPWQVSAYLRPVSELT